MSQPRLHFSYETTPGKESVAAFAQTLMGDTPNVAFEDADIVVTVGGDGSLLHAFRRAARGQKVFGVVPPDSNSRGFWTNHDIRTRGEFDAALKAAQSYPICPVRGDLVYTNGCERTIRGFNEVAINDHGGQAVLLNVSVETPKSTIGPLRIMGDGIIIAAPFGSTALNFTYGGPAIDINNSGFVLTGKGIYEPQRGFNPIVMNDNTKLHIEFLSSAKRKFRIDHDGRSIYPADENPLKYMHIQKDRDHCVDLLLTDDPATRAFTVLIKAQANKPA